MESFINLMGNVVYTPKQLKNRMAAIEKSKVSTRDEEVLTRYGMEIALGMVTPDQETLVRLNDFRNAITPMVAYSDLVSAENNLLFRTIQYEQATTRLAQYIKLDGVAEVLHVPATYDEFGVELTPEVLYVAPIEALPEFVEVTTCIDDLPVVETIRNPLVVQDEEERAVAQTTITNADQGVLDLAVLRTGG